MCLDKLKDRYVSIHIIAAGAGAEIQQKLWSIPGCSSFFSGASFPYAQEEMEEILGFVPEQFVSETTAIDLAAAAYMKAFHQKGKSPIGIGVTASVASEKSHRGDHRFYVSIITDTQVKVGYWLLDKGVGFEKRKADGQLITDTVLSMLLGVLDMSAFAALNAYKDVSVEAVNRFFAHPYFQANGKRLQNVNNINYVIMPGAYNPPHEGHFGLVSQYESLYSGKVIFNITTNPPHKDELNLQACLKQAKMLQGTDRLFSRNDPLYIDKARKHPNTPIIIGADAFLRLFDSKWDPNIEASMEEFKSLGTKFFVGGRVVDGKFLSLNDVITTFNVDKLYQKYLNLFVELPGRWDITSSEIRNKK
jgi:nicotinic acid mononucleotide adenylyltransferase/nicotinamide mononucleotide (NMN) deamidase PncC